MSLRVSYFFIIKDKWLTSLLSVATSLGSNLSMTGKFIICILFTFIFINIYSLKHLFIMEITREKSYGKISIDSVQASSYQKAGTLTCQLRQVINTKTTYPSVQLSDGVSDSLFGSSEFTNVAEGQTYENNETRIAWINVPSDTTVQAVQAKLDALYSAGKEPCIMKIVSNEPILTDNQLNAISRGLKTMDDFANSQVVRYGENHPNGNVLILDDNGNPMYKRTFFQSEMVEDENRCSADKVYVSAEIAEELSATAENTGIVF